MPLRRTMFVNGMDAAWVLASVAVLEVGILPTVGNVMVAAVAAVVLVFAILEVRGIRGPEVA